MSSNIQVQGQVYVSVKSSAQKASSNQGAWVRPDGTSHSVEIIDKGNNRFSFLTKLKLLFSREKVYVDMGEHILVLKKKSIRNTSLSESINETTAAFKALGKTQERNPLHFITEDSPIHLRQLLLNPQKGSEKQSKELQELLEKTEKAPAHDKPQWKILTLGSQRWLITCKKKDDGSLSLTSQGESWATNKTIDPAISNQFSHKLAAVLEQDQQTGSANVFVSKDETLMRVTIDKDENSCLYCNFTPLFTGSLPTKIKDLLKNDPSKARRELLALQAEAQAAGSAKGMVLIDGFVHLVTCGKNPTEPGKPETFSLTTERPHIESQDIHLRELFTKQLGTDPLPLLQQAQKTGAAYAFVFDEISSRLVKMSKEGSQFSLAYEPESFEGRLPPELQKHLILNQTGARADLQALLSEAKSSGSSKKIMVIGTQARYVSCTQNAHGSFSITVSTEPMVYDNNTSLAFQQNPTFRQIFHSLENGTRDGKAKVKPALPELLKKAYETGTASVLVSVGNQMYRAIVTRQDGSFGLTYSPSQLLTKSELDAMQKAGIDVSNPAILANSMNWLYMMYAGALQAKSYAAANAALRGFSVKARSEIQFDLGNGKRAILQLHIKEDGTITVGVGESLGDGSFKAAVKMSRFGVHHKVYVEAKLKDLSQATGFKEEYSKLEDLQDSNYVVGSRHISFRTGLLIDASTGASLCTEEAVMKTELCNKGSATSITETVPKDDKERFDRLWTLRTAMQGVAHIHKKGLAHMDIKPANIFITTLNGKAVGKIADIDTHVEGDLSVSTLFYEDLDSLKSFAASLGTAASQAHDIWSLGLTLFQAMYGYNPETRYMESLLNESPLAKSLFAKKPRPSSEQVLADLINDPSQQFEAGLVTACKVPGQGKTDALIRKMLDPDREKRPKLDQAFFDEYDAAMKEWETPPKSSLSKSKPRTA